MNDRRHVWTWQSNHDPGFQLLHLSLSTRAVVKLTQEVKCSLEHADMCLDAHQQYLDKHVKHQLQCNPRRNFTPSTIADTKIPHQRDMQHAQEKTAAHCFYATVSSGGDNMAQQLPQPSCKYVEA
jgi:hypothetical protein